MSKYTTEVRFICENYAGYEESVGANRVDEILESVWNKIFTTKCTFFDENYRKILCKKILKHYYLREIGAETVGIWKLWMNTRLEELMPYYNQLYESELIQFNPMHDVDVTTTHDRKNTGNTTETTTGGRDITSNRTTQKSGNRTTQTEEEQTGNKTGESKDVLNGTRDTTMKDETSQNGTNTDKTTQNGTTSETTDNSNTTYDLYSDTPQGALTGVENETYLTNARKKSDSGSGKTDGTSAMTTEGNGTSSLDTNSSGKTNEIVNNTTTGNTTENTKNDRDVLTKEIWSENGADDYTENETSTGDKKGTANSTEEFLEHVAGKRGGDSYSSLLLKYRETFLNIDMAIIDKFANLFMGLW